MKVFIDGSAGTTGLVIGERLRERTDIVVQRLAGAMRKNGDARRAALNGSDIALLCLPDSAAREALTLIENPSLRVIDTSTAHRTASGWAYGFPELSDVAKNKIRSADRVSVPGCHASGFIALMHPLISAGIVPADAVISCTSLTGYSGGGKAMIETYEQSEAHALQAPRSYALDQAHKHLPEMQLHAALSEQPVFQPIVAAYAHGMLVSIPLHRKQLNPGYLAADVAACLRQAYRGPVIFFVDRIDQDGFACANRLAGSDAMEVTVTGNASCMLLLAQYDNLGKGAAGAAIQCLNLMTGQAETKGLRLEAGVM